MQLTLKPIDFNIVLYHSNCSDGIAGAFPFWRENKSRFCDIIPPLKNLEGEPFFALAVRYNEEPPYNLLKNQNVAIVDFSYKKDITEKICNIAKFVLVLDHHITAKEDLENLQLKNLKVIFDMTQSGAQIAWKYCYPNEPIPWFIDLIADRDLWTWKLEKSREITDGLKKNGYMHWENMEQLLPLKDKHLEECKEEMYRTGQQLAKKREKMFYCELNCKPAMKFVGFWKEENSDEYTESPIPNSEKRCKEEVNHFLNCLKHILKYKYDKMDRYMGYSDCRICGKNNDSCEYQYQDYCFPSGYLHYIQDHQVEIPLDFYEEICKIDLNDCTLSKGRLDHFFFFEDNSPEAVKLKQIINCIESTKGMSGLLFGN